MSDITADPLDPLDELLAPPTSGDAGLLRRRVLEQTTRVLRRRRHGRLAAVLGGAAAGLLLGLAYWLATHPATDRPPPFTKGVPAALGGLGGDPPNPPTALADEWRAFDAADRRAEKYRRAGDRYLAEDDDPASALRCYGAALDADASLAADPDDSWLLMLVKDARIKEKSHAKRGG